MPAAVPPPLSPNELLGRQRRLLRVARELGFVGRVEYRHAYSQSGGAQYGFGKTTHRDAMIAYAEAFERDANPDDFTLEAIVAHECGHQLLHRHPRIARRVGLVVSAAREEVLASLLGSMLVERASDKDALVAKAVVELIQRGKPGDEALALLWQLRLSLEALL